MTKAEKREIKKLESDQMFDDMNYLEDDLRTDPDALDGQDCELDYYPEDEFDQAQRTAEFGVIDPLYDNSDE